MIISINWLKKFTSIDMPINELVELIGSRLVEVERVVDLGVKYKDVVVSRVVSAEKLEGSDHLSICKIDDAGAVEGVERDSDGFVQVVCGAPNVATDQMIAWLPPKTIVPQTYNSSEPFILDSRKLRGETSNGMIASARELDLFDEHDGILVLDSDLKPGTSFAKAYELDDFLLDIENKSLTHRPDTFGIIGFAREIAAIQGNKFASPELLNCSSFGTENAGDQNLSVIIENPELCSRYQAVVVAEAEDKKSPLIIQTYLARVGVRPINAIVDVTNYMMMLTGQPLHAFDFDKLVKVSGGKADIHVRNARTDEELELLDGKMIKLSIDDIVISAGDKAIGLAGAMGGSNTGIDENTKNIILESASFNLYNLRGTQMRHGIFSEAITRFTKGQPADLTMPVLCEAVRLMSEWASVKPVSGIVESYPSKQKDITIGFSIDDVNKTLGTKLDESQLKQILENTEFGVTINGQGSITVTAPWWRADIHIKEDVIEEVGRLYGFDNIEPILPMRDFVAVRPGSFDIFRDKIRGILVKAGANEVLTYSFVHGDCLRKALQNPADSYRIINSISPDLQYYRQTLTPSLMNLVHPNVKQGFDKFAIFEINKSHIKTDGLTEEGVPVENESIALIVTSKEKQFGSPYYQAKKILNYLFDVFGVNVNFTKNDQDTNPWNSSFEPKRSASIFDENNNLIGIVGEYKTSVAKSFKLPEFVAGFELNLRSLFKASEVSGRKYTKISRYPSVERDLCFKVSNEIEYQQIVNTVSKAIEPTVKNYHIEPIDIYEQKENRTKNITIRVRLNAYDHTMTGQEVSEIVNVAINTVSKELGATVI